MELCDLTAESILNVTAIDERLIELEADLAPGGLEGEERQDAAEEQRQLTEFKGKFGNEWDGLQFINESYWDTYAAEEASGIYGAATSTPYWDDGKWADAMTADYGESELDGTMFRYHL
jgi:hypothetical protein